MAISGRVVRVLAVLCLLTAAASFFGRSARAQTTTTWTATTSSSWNTAGNWDNGVPTSTSNAVIGTTLLDNFSVTLDTPASVNNLTLSSGSTLTFDPNETLTVSGALGTPTYATQLNGQTNVSYGTLTLNSSGGAGSNTNINNGTLTLATLVFTILGHTVLLDSGTTNGTGTLENNNLIQGSGTISLNLINSGKIDNNDGGTLSLTGNIQNSGGTIVSELGQINLAGGTITGGTVAPGTFSIQNETFSNVTLVGSTDSPIQLTSGSTLTVASGGATNQGSLNLAAGTVISGPGTIQNSGSPGHRTTVSGAGTISTDIFNAGVISATDSASSLILQGNITQHAELGTGIISLGPGSLVLDGAQVSGGTIAAVGGTGELTANNGATLTGVTLDGTSSPLVLSGGSTLGISGGLIINGQVQLGSGAQGPALTAASGTPTISILQNSTLDGGGSVGMAILNNGSIIADNSSVALVLHGHVSGNGTLSATSGATLTLDPITVTASMVGIDAGSTLNGGGTINAPQVANYGMLDPGAGAPGQITIDGVYTQGTGGALNFELGGTGAGQFSQLFVEGTDPYIVGPVAIFDSGATIDAEFFSGFDPSSGCGTVFGVCESFVLVEVADGTISGFSNLAFDPLSALPSGFTWQLLEADNDQEIVLDIDGMVSTTSGGGGGSGGSGGTTPTPEPSGLALLCVGLLAAVLRRRKLREGLAF